MPTVHRTSRRGARGPKGRPMKYCIGCGKQGVHWPPKADNQGVLFGLPVLLACSMQCLANRVVNEYMGGGDGFHCNDCGEWTDSDHCGFSGSLLESS